MDLQPPWHALSSSQSAGLVSALHDQICEKHPLYQLPLTAIAMNDEEYDDFLYSIDDGSGRIAFVHLTWKQESNPEFPFTKIYTSLKDYLD